MTPFGKPVVPEEHKIVAIDSSGFISATSNVSSIGSSSFRPTH